MKRLLSFALASLMLFIPCFASETPESLSLQEFLLSDAVTFLPDGSSFSYLNASEVGTRNSFPLSSGAGNSSNLSWGLFPSGGSDVGFLRFTDLNGSFVDLSKSGYYITLVAFRVNKTVTLAGGSYFVSDAAPLSSPPSYDEPPSFDSIALNSFARNRVFYWSYGYGTSWSSLIAGQRVTLPPGSLIVFAPSVGSFNSSRLTEGDGLAMQVKSQTGEYVVFPSGSGGSGPVGPSPSPASGNFIADCLGALTVLLNSTALAPFVGVFLFLFTAGFVKRYILAF